MLSGRKALRCVHKQLMMGVVATRPAGDVLDGFRSGDAIAVVDRQLMIRGWNVAAESLTGIPASAAIGRRCWTVLAGHNDRGEPVCQATCALARRAFRLGDVTRRPLVVKTSHCKRRVNVTTIVAAVGGQARLVHVLFAADSPKQRPYAGLKALTEREREVLTLLGEGEDAQAVALRLGISLTTVRTHIRHILTRLGVSSQLAAVSYARHAAEG